MDVLPFSHNTPQLIMKYPNQFKVGDYKTTHFGFQLSIAHPCPPYMNIVQRQLHPLHNQFINKSTKTFVILETED
jgi:hypothetical protein